MDVSELVLAFVSVMSAITGGVVKSIMTDIKDLEHNMNQCQRDLPMKFILKDDYHSDMTEIKTELRENGKKIDQIWKHMRIGK
ncbi:MAG: hypothetical protein NZ824_03470 [Candidatus Thioglobus sp.]|nr:hypothetical protein [Candidatus Thioglobus sp.]